MSDDVATVPVLVSPSPPAPAVIKHVPATDIRNPWICKDDDTSKGCGAILGSVVHDKIRGGLSLSRLIVFRGAVRIEEYLPANFVFGKVDAGEFTCSRCGKTRAWHPSPEVILYHSNAKSRKRNRNV